MARRAARDERDHRRKKEFFPAFARASAAEGEFTLIKFFSSRILPPSFFPHLFIFPARRRLPAGSKKRSVFVSSFFLSFYVKRNFEKSKRERFYIRNVVLGIIGLEFWKCSLLLVNSFIFESSNKYVYL